MDEPDAKGKSAAGVPHAVDAFVTRLQRIEGIQPVRKY
jgi:hypothetical protein